MAANATVMRRFCARNAVIEMAHFGEWQASCVSLRTRGHQLLINGHWTDCKFVFGREPVQVIISGHKLLLAMASPVFAAMFYGSMSQDVIDIEDIEPEIFKHFLMYIYFDDFKMQTIDEATDLYYVAKKYMIPHLQKKCLKCIANCLEPKNVCQIYEIAKFYDEYNLMKKCLEVISDNTSEVLSARSFEEIKLETMIDIFKLEDLSINRELDLFDAALRYKNAQKKQIPTTTPNNLISRIENNIKTLKECSNVAPNKVKTITSSTPSMRNAMENIRFLSFTPKEFAEGPANSDLLTKEEILAIFMKISSPNGDFAMPEGFTTWQIGRKKI